MIQIQTDTGVGRKSGACSFYEIRLAENVPPGSEILGRFLCGIAKRYEIVGQCHKEDTADHIAKGDKEKIRRVGRDCDGNGGACGIQHGDTVDAHIGNAVFESAYHKNQDAPQCHDQFSGFGSHLDTAPDSHADQDIAEDSTYGHLQGGQGKLAARCGEKVGLDGGNFVQAGQVIHKDSDPASDQIAQIADCPKTDGVRPSHIAAESAGGQNEVISGEQFTAGHNDQTQSRCKTDGGEQSGCRYAFQEQISAGGHGDEAAECDEDTGQYGCGEIADGIGFQKLHFFPGCVRDVAVVGMKHNKYLLREN